MLEKNHYPIQYENVLEFSTVMPFNELNCSLRMLKSNTGPYQSLNFYSVVTVKKFVLLTALQ